jgi:hypothetical protein
VSAERERERQTDRQTDRQRGVSEAAEKLSAYYKSRATGSGWLIHCGSVQMTVSKFVRLYCSVDPEQAMKGSIGDPLVTFGRSPKVTSGSPIYAEKWDYLETQTCDFLHSDH